MVTVDMMWSVHGYDCVYGHANESGSDHDRFRVHFHGEFRSDCEDYYADSRSIDSTALIYSQSIVMIGLNVNVRENANVNVRVRGHVHDDYS
ncbi:predicted protein [Sclerotinia sclerotiorum 1980 UF-70]|uniref:Uncharacterized protein n=1 Tax=Sclerotinia sclerotiorum (strain ATCC 18683 / 1980 / Ss-1) TaxID=665079 RepID=A7ECF8_SCLS1|nr:predicted protein [Sclerotinia sclerotiorum 1980 UF-70]EDO00137.1 predicted protein [Sclerotinia sclerotiorum 1980 UF-70]